MGCFSYSCAVSNLPIHVGDWCYVIPLTATHTNSRFIDKHMPLCPPIKGQYNDYGMLENVVESSVTKALENHFKASIYKILEVMLSTRKDGTRSPIEYNGCGALMEAFGPRSFDWYKVSRDGVRQLGFEVDKNGYITHPKICHTDHKFVVSRSKDGNTIVHFDRADRKLKRTTLRGYDELCHEFLKLAQKNKLGFVTHFIFGVPMDGRTQDKLWRLHNTAASFVRAEVYEEWVKLSASYIEKDQIDNLDKAMSALLSVDELQRLRMFEERSVVEYSPLAGIFWNPTCLFEGAWCYDVARAMTKFARFQSGMIATNAKFRTDNSAGEQYCSYINHAKYIDVVNRLIRIGVKKERRDCL